MTKVSLTDLRRRLYEAYDSQHAGGRGGEAAAFVYWSDIRALLPPPAAGLVVDLGCGRSELVRLLQADGFDAVGIDISPERAALARVVSGCYRIALPAETCRPRGHIVIQDLKFAARKDVVIVKPAS